jgi:hypothetical protein
MLYGIIYEYVDTRTGDSAYVGKSSSMYGFAHALKTAHRRHLRGRDPIPFDYVLRDDSTVFSLDILDRLTADRVPALQVVLKPLEKARVRTRRPRYNHVRFVH